MKFATASSAPSLSQRAIRGAAWTLSTSLGTRLVGLVGTLVLARYVVPSEYGEVSAAVILVASASTMTSFGVGIYLVTNRNISRAEAFHATCWLLVTGVAALGATWALCGPLGRWFGAPHLYQFMPLIAASTLLERVVKVPERMLVRELRFGWLSLARGIGELVYTAVSLTAAMRGFGAMSIAWGNLARSVFRFATIAPAVAWREWLEPHPLNPPALLRIIGYGVNVSVTSIASFAMRRWDNLLVSRYLGPGVMGAYNYAYNLADTPAVAVGEQVSDVISASLPHTDRDKRKIALMRSSTMTSIVMLPLAFGLGAVAHTVVETFLAPCWASVGDMLVLLSVLSVTRPLTHILLSYFYACQRPTVVLWVEWLSLFGVVAAIAIVGRNGIAWTCGAVGAVFVLRTLLAAWLVQWLDGVPLSAFFAPLAMPIVACVLMVGAIVAVRPALHGLPGAVQLCVEVALGAAVYLAGARLLFRRTSDEFIHLLRSAFSR
jgi:PST family polysaccharide transporter